MSGKIVLVLWFGIKKSFHNKLLKCCINSIHFCIFFRSKFNKEKKKLKNGIEDVVINCKQTKENIPKMQED